MRSCDGILHFPIVKVSLPQLVGGQAMMRLRG